MREMQDAWRNLLVSAAAIALYRYWETPFFSPGAPNHENLQILTVCLLLFLLIFFRFLRGDELYLQERHPASAGEGGSMSGIGQSFDILALLLHGAIFTGLGLSAVKPEFFVRIYGILLVVNAIWLWINRETAKKKVFLGKEEGIWLACSPGQDAARVWIRNNFATAFFLLVSESLWQAGMISQSIWIFLGLTACFVNSVIDIKLTWSFYFPSRSGK